MNNLQHNVDAFDQVLGLSTQVGDSYKPGSKSIEFTALTALLEESKKSIAAVNKAESNLAKAINDRQRAFRILPTLGTQIKHVAASCGMNEDDLKDLDRLTRRFRPQPFGTPDGEENAGTSAEEQTVRRNRSLSFQTKADNFKKVVDFLESHAIYTPVDANFTVEGLAATHAMLKGHNLSVYEARAALLKARIEARTKILDRTNGIYARARMVKSYFRGILGTNADLFRAISRIEFKGR